MSILERAREHLANIHPDYSEILLKSPVSEWPAWAQYDFKPVCDALVAVRQDALNKPFPGVCGFTDTELLNWMISHGAYLSYSRDGECCNVWFRHDPNDETNDSVPVEGFPQKRYNDPREAIAAAMRHFGFEFPSALIDSPKGERSGIIHHGQIQIPRT
jgi:hypothetical protein